MLPLMSKVMFIVHFMYTFYSISSTFPGRIHENKARFVLLMIKDQVNDPVIGIKTFEPTSGFCWAK